MIGMTATALVALLTHAPAPRQGPDDARALLDTALARMGGEALLAGIEQVRFEMLTQWLVNPSFDSRPFQDFPSYERHTDERDYSLDAWRNTRHFGVGSTARTIVDLVSDGAAVRDFGNGPEPLNVAYVDEWSEIRSYTPDRFLLAARRADDLTTGSDTIMGGLVHARIEATVEGRHVTAFLRRSDGLPAMVRFHTPEPNDFGLVPWGDMEVEVWYSIWRSYPNGVSLPTQLDVRRIGTPYKRMTVLAADFDPDIPADSFRITDDLRSAFIATQNHPMHDLQLDSARVLEGRFVDFHTFGAPAGAVRVGDGWVLLESGQAPLSLDRAMQWLAGHPAGGQRTGADGRRGAGAGRPSSDAAHVSVAVLGSRRGNGGAAALVGRGVPMLVGAGVAPTLATILRNHGEEAAPFEIVTTERRIHIGGDSLVVARFDLPDAAGSVAIYVPSLRWVFSPDVSTDLDRSLLLRLAADHGWGAERIGTSAALVQELAPTGTDPGRGSRR